MYDPEDLPLDRPLMARVREALTHTAIESPLESELLGLLRQGADPENRPDRWKHVAYAAIERAEGLEPHNGGAGRND